LNVSAIQWVFVGAGLALECLVIWAWLNSPPFREAGRRNRQG
jgi:hypothetical protein